MDRGRMDGAVSTGRTTNEIVLPRLCTRKKIGGDRI